MAPHVVYRTKLSLHIQNQLGKILFTIILDSVISSINLRFLDAMNVHVMSPVEVFIEPLGLCGRMRVMLIVCQDFKFHISIAVFVPRLSGKSDRKKLFRIPHVWYELDLREN